LIINSFGKLPNNSLVRMADSHRTVPALGINRRIIMRKPLVIFGKLLVLVLVVFALCERVFAAEKLTKISEFAKLGSDDVQKIVTAIQGVLPPRPEGA
jgi:hypothetical protein